MRFTSSLKKQSFSAQKALHKAACYAYQTTGHLVDNPSVRLQPSMIKLDGAVEKTSVPPAVYIQEHLERFSGTSAFCDLEEECERLLAMTAEHMPAMLVEFGKAYVFNGGIINSKNKFHPRPLISDTKTNISSEYLSQSKHIGRGVLVDQFASNQYFGHWMHDELPSLFIKNLPAETQNIAIHAPFYQHAQGYLDLLTPKINYQYRGVVDELYLLLDYTQNSAKQQRYLEMRAAMSQYVDKDRKPAQGVYIMRGNSGAQRRLDNEPELIEHLSKLGFDIIAPERMTALEIVNKLWDAPLVISIEGSAVGHALLPIAKHAGVLLIQPPNRVAHIFKGILDAKGHPYGFYTALASGENSFYIDSFDQLDYLIDKMYKASAMFDAKKSIYQFIANNFSSQHKPVSDNTSRKNTAEATSAEKMDSTKVI